MAEFIKVATVGELESGEMKLIELEGKKIVLTNLEGSYYAFDDECTHVGGPLSDGDLIGEEVTCPWHGSVFNVKTGEVITAPARRAIATYKVKIEDSDILVSPDG